MEMEIEKVFSDIRISGEFYGNDIEKVQKIIEPARKVLDIMEDNFGSIQCEIYIRENKVRVSAFNSEHVFETKFYLEVSKNSFKYLPEKDSIEEIADELKPYVMEIYKNL